MSIPSIPALCLCLILLLGTIPTVVTGLDEDVLIFGLDEANPAHTIVFPWFVEVLGVIVFFLLRRFESPVPYAGVMFLMGTFMGIGAVYAVRRVEHSSELDQLTTSILQWSNITSSVLLLVFLPGLIFRDAIEVNFNLFVKALPQILIFAFPMVLVGTALTGLVGYYVIPYGWPWSLAATLGAVLASTDPIAVSSVLKSAGAPPRLQMQISGESLLNDGSAVVFFTIFSQQFLSTLGYAEAVGWGEGIAIFFRMSLGGVTVGIAFAIGLLFILHELDRRLEPEYNVLQVVSALTIAYLSYYVSEQVCAMSGVIACVVCGITARALGRGMITDNRLMDSYLALMEFLLNTLLFALGGVVWGEVIAEKYTKKVRWNDWMYLLALYALVSVIRVFQIGMFYPLLSRIGLKSNWKEAIFLSYGGIRGAVGVALALSLTRSVREFTGVTLEASEQLEFLAGGVTLLTLLVNGTMAGPVLRLLDLAKPVTSRKRALRLFENQAREYMQKEYVNILLEKRFMRTNFNVIKTHVPFVRAEPALSPAQRSTRDASYETNTHDDDVQHWDRLLNITEIGCPQEIMVEARQIFLELLNEAYYEELANGQLDEREDNGQINDLLTQSVRFAISDVDHNEPINDFEYTQGTPYVEDAYSFIVRKYKQYMGKHSDQNNCCSYEYQRDRTMVLRSIAFIEAHRQAEEKLMSFMNSMQTISMDENSQSLMFANAVEIVVEESAKQVREAKKVLLKFPRSKIESITSHYVCSILLHRLATFVEKCAADSILTKKEAALYLDRIEKNLQAAHTCQREFPSTAPDDLESFGGGGGDSSSQKQSKESTDECSVVNESENQDSNVEVQ